ncbi:MAG TPA: GNAT family N-acetyltransferase [Candidatus Nanoarchaeia archaeon]|nr:GNAT family N-acetyltransferase [Candidatus Nanoarchaeia archaeon]
MEIRAATARDLADLMRLQSHLVHFERPFDPTIRKGKVQYYDIKKLLRSNRAKVVVAVYKKIVGCGFGEIQKDVNWSVNKRKGYIGLMYVEPAFRGQRIGRRIITELSRWLKSYGINDIRLRLYTDNVAALHAYRAYGFKDFILEMRKTL